MSDSPVEATARSLSAQPHHVVALFRALSAQCLSVRARSQLLHQRSLLLRERSRALQARCGALHERSSDLRERSRQALKICDVVSEQCRSVRDNEAISLGVVAAPTPTDMIRPRYGKLVHKNRWLISADMVAALARAGVDCNILIPGGEPWRQKIGWSQGCRPH